MSSLPDAPVPIGTIVAFALGADSMPPDWLLCNGHDIPPQYHQLSVLLNSNNKTPNLIGRTLIGAGPSPAPPPPEPPQSDGANPQFPAGAFWTVGYTGGEWQHLLTADEIPEHSHTIKGGDFGYHYRSFAHSDDGDDYAYETDPSHKLQGTDKYGGSKTHNNVQPFYALNYIIYAGPPS